MKDSLLVAGAIGALISAAPIALFGIKVSLAWSRKVARAIHSRLAHWLRCRAYRMHLAHLRPILAHYVMHEDWPKIRDEVARESMHALDMAVTQRWPVCGNENAQYGYDYPIGDVLPRQFLLNQLEAYLLSGRMLERRAPCIECGFYGGRPYLWLRRAIRVGWVNE